MTFLHVLSRGRAPEHDYRWVAVETEPHPPRPERPPRLEARAAQLVQSDHPSLLVVRVGDELLLFVSALESSRVDVQGRPIRNAFSLTVATDGEDLVRGVARQALLASGRKHLEQRLDAAITDTEDGGFDVQTELKGWLCGLQEPPPSQAAETVRRFGPSDAEDRDGLAEELGRSALPPGEGPLIVVTGAVSAERLEASGTWRGLSRLVNAPFEGPPLEVRRSSKKGGAARLRRLGFLLTAAATLLLLRLWPEAR